MNHEGQEPGVRDQGSAVTRQENAISAMEDLLGEGTEQEIADEVEAFRRQLAHDLRRARARDQRHNDKGIIEV